MSLPSLLLNQRQQQQRKVGSSNSLLALSEHQPLLSTSSSMMLHPSSYQTAIRSTSSSPLTTASSTNNNNNNNNEAIITDERMHLPPLDISFPPNHQQEQHSSSSVNSARSCSSSSSSKPRKRNGSSCWCYHRLQSRIIDPPALQFATRMATLLTISSLFVTRHWMPDGMWVLVSVLFVTWFPSLDAASVMEKIVQRLIGTFVGATLGLSYGFCTLALPAPLQSVFLTAGMFVLNFGVIFLAGHVQVGRKKVIRRYAYATILCVLTLCICLLPFGLQQEHAKWKHGVSRVCNVLVGCLLGAVGSMVVCPKSTADVLHDKTARQVQLAGQAARAVLTLAANSLAGRTRVHALADELLESPLPSSLPWKMSRRQSIINSGSDDGSSTTQTSATTDADVALKKYEDALTDWNASKALFPLAKFDPFYFLPCSPHRRTTTTTNANSSSSSSSMQQQQGEIAKTLARAMRLQTTIVVLDGMIRSETDFEFGSDKDCALLETTAERIQHMLTLPLSEKNDKAALELFDSLQYIQTKIRALSLAVASPDESMQQLNNFEMAKFKSTLVNSSSTSPSSDSGAGDDDEENGGGVAIPSCDNDDDDFGRGFPTFASARSGNSLFFLQLVEHLILRSLRLFQAWKHVEAAAPRTRQPIINNKKCRFNNNNNTSSSDDLESVRSMVIG